MRGPEGWIEIRCRSACYPPRACVRGGRRGTQLGRGGLNCQVRKGAGQCPSEEQLVVRLGCRYRLPVAFSVVVGSGVRATRWRRRCRMSRTIAGRAARVAERSPPPSWRITIDPGRTAESTRCAISLAEIPGLQSVARERPAGRAPLPRGRASGTSCRRAAGTAVAALRVWRGFGR